MKMKRGELYPLVCGLMLAYPLLRDDDNALEIEVCRNVNPEFDRLSAAEFINLRDKLGFPSRESIGRIRRLVQENIEELQASEECKRKRTKSEEEWKEFVRDGKR